ncbi:MAG: hypothetical protein ABI947_05195 [Chloroflexota bacterium]
MTNMSYNDLDAKLDQAEQLINDQKLAQAKPIIVQAIQQDSLSIRAYFYLSDVDIKNRSKTLKHIKLLTPRSPTEQRFKQWAQERIQLDIVDSFRKANQLDQAYERLEQVLKMVPDSIRGLYYQSKLSYTTEEQRESLQKAQALKPRTAEEQIFKTRAVQRLKQLSAMPTPKKKKNDQFNSDFDNEYIDEFPSPPEKPKRGALPGQPVPVSSGMLTQDEFQKALANTRSFTGSAVLTLFMYWFFWLPGLVVNILFLREARQVSRQIGRDPSGTGCLYFLLIVNLIPILGGFMMFASMIGLGRPAMVPFGSPQVPIFTQPQTYHDARFDIRYPGGWVMGPTGGYQYSYVTMGTLPRTNSMYNEIYPTLQSGEVIVKIFAYSKKEYLPEAKTPWGTPPIDFYTTYIKQIPPINSSSPQSFQLGNISGARGDLSPRGAQGQLLIFYKDDHLFLISILTAPNEMSKYRTTFETMIQSITPNSGVTISPSARESTPTQATQTTAAKDPRLTLIPTAH